MNSRASYFKKRRETNKNFSVYIDKIKMEKFEAVLDQLGKTKTEWLENKIDEELHKDRKDKEWLI